MKKNLAGRITEFFLTNRPLTILLLVATVLGGVFAYTQMPKQYNPTISLPAFQIRIDYPGASVEEVEQFVTRELEEKISDIPGVDKIYSQSIDGGTAILNVQFEVGEDLEDAQVRVRSKIANHLDLLTGKMQPPVIKNIDPEDVPILTIGLWDPGRSQNEVRARVTELVHQLKVGENFANLEVHGGERPALKVLLDPARLKQRAVTVSDILFQIRQGNQSAKTGLLRTGTRTIVVEATGQFHRASDLEKLMIKPGIQLRDVAEIREGFQEKTAFTQIHTKDKTPINAVFLSVAKRKGSNSTLVAEEILQKFEGLLSQPRFDSLQYTIFRNEGETAQDAIGGLMQNLFLAVVIVSGVLFVFLGWRSATLVAIAIPLTLALVFVLGFLGGHNINRVSLFALILSLGLLVDSATVVAENIHRHLKKQVPRKEAIVRAVNEVGIGLFLSTLTSVIVFLPTSQISGMMGDYMGPLSFFVPMALLMSLLVAYVFTPFLADLVMQKTARPPSKNIDVFGRLTRWYRSFLERMLGSSKKQKRFLWTVFFLFLLALALPLTRLVHFKMLPTADREQFFVWVDAPRGTDVPQTQSVSEKIIALLLQHPEVQSVQSFVGTAPVVDFNGLFRGVHQREAAHLATLRVNLSHPNDRSTPSTEIIHTLRNEISSTGKIPPRWDVRFVEDPPGPPVRATLLAKIKGRTWEEMNLAAAALEKRFEGTEGVVDIQTSVEEAGERLLLKIDHEKAAQSGIDSGQIFALLQATSASFGVSQFHNPAAKEIAMIELQVAPEKRNAPDDLQQLSLTNAAGNTVPLLSVVDILSSRTVPVRHADQHEPTVYVSGEMQGRSVVYAVLDLLRSLKKNPPQGLSLAGWNLFGLQFQTDTGHPLTLEWDGEWKMTLENFRDLGIAMLIAFFAIYFVLVAQFRNFTTPRLIMTTIPLSLIGILFGFFLLDRGAGIFLTATSLIGFIALMGLVVNNAILFLEYFSFQRKEGKSLHDALVRAGEIRLRPILLTSLTTILGNLTIAADPVWSGLAWAIVFGLSLSAVLTLGVFPVLLWQNLKESA